MTIRPLALAALILTLTGCGETVPQKQRPQTIAAPPIKLATGIDRVMGKDARSLVQLFGPAAQDVREASSRKLQFSGASCILDAYLYPPAKGKEPVVTFLAARVPDGRDADKASCVSALSQRR
jgi:predicted small lipoprotein YifL